MAKRTKRREWNQRTCSRVKNTRSSKDASSKNREVAQADTTCNAAEGVLARCVVGFAPVGIKAVTFR
jgi:hypothetical protein